jgi:2',3'-cyclic-nucleotide 2'-phosphodiesterase (5'-nucleotidase family)
MLVATALLSGSSYARSSSVTIEIAHTNDLHSHFRPSLEPPYLGGLGRIKTQVDQLRQQNPELLLIDGGDWSEGQVYYTLDTGTSSLNLMSDIGYDIAVVGNHDWLNGADTLLQSAETRTSKNLTLLASNLNFKSAPSALSQRWKQSILPYTIKTIQGVKVAFIGLLTDENFYDSYLKPIQITSVTSTAARLSRQLKKSHEADLVIAISHNSIETNQKILQLAPQLDMIIGAHDHQKLTEPKVVQRPFSHDGYIVETGCWGKFLGHFKIKYSGPRQWSLENYQLHPIFADLPSDTTIDAKITELERLIESRQLESGQLDFHQEITENHAHFDRSGMENLMGNLTTEAYRASVPDADLALDQARLIYGGLYPGKLHSTDFYNSLSAIYNPKTDRSWTLHTFEMQGKTLLKMLKIAYFIEKITTLSPFSFSGMSVIYDPLFKKTKHKKPSILPYDSSLKTMGEWIENEESDLEINKDSKVKKIGIIRSVTLHNQPLDRQRWYKIVTSEGLLQAIRYINQLLPQFVKIRNLQDTHIEAWTSLKDYVVSHQNSLSEEVQFERVRSFHTDTQIHINQLQVQLNPTLRSTTSNEVVLDVQAEIKNRGYLKKIKHPIKVHIVGNLNGADDGKKPRYIDLAPITIIDPASGVFSQKTLNWTVTVPGSHSFYPVSIYVEALPGEENQTNQMTTYWFQH